MTLFRFVMKSGTRNRRRSLFTIISVALALFVMSTLAGVVQQIDSNLEESSPLRLITRHSVSLANVLPEKYRARIEQIPGVRAVTGLSYFGGIYIEPKQTDFAQFAADTDSLLEIVPEIKVPPDQREAFLKDRTGVLVGRSKAAKHGWKPGSRITLKGVYYPVNLELTVRGIFASTINQEGSVYFHRAYLEEAMNRPGVAGSFWVLAGSAEAVPQICEAVDEMFRNTDAPTKTETEKAFTMGFISMLGNLKGLVAMLSGIIIFTTLLVTANTMAMSVRERIREIAVMKALGFTKGKILLLFAGEGSLLAGTGGLAGSLGARLLIGSMDLASYSQGFFQVLEIRWEVVAVSVVLSTLVGLAGTGVPAWRAVSRTVADGLRHVG